jgi:hypothetical protein
MLIKTEGGRGHWTVFLYNPQKFYNKVFLFVILIFLGSFIEFLLVVSLS